MLSLHPRVIPEVGKAVHQEQSEVIVGVVVFGKLIDVVVFSTSGQRDRVVVEGFWVGRIHICWDQGLRDVKLKLKYWLKYLPSVRVSG